ncbi:MAG: hypothetical protein KAJ15_14890, partial [Spirochaetes bacterium]|nr:hypothetical protein [Spirochaetota bacterium]
MKKLLLSIFIVFLVAPVLVMGGRKKGAEEPKKAEEAPAVVEEEPAAEDTRANEVDPWIIDVRKGLEKYRGKIVFKGPLGQT